MKQTLYPTDSLQPLEDLNPVADFDQMVNSPVVRSAAESNHFENLFKTKLTWVSENGTITAQPQFNLLYPVGKKQPYAAFVESASKLKNIGGGKVCPDNELHRKRQPCI